MSTIILVRHAETALAGRFCGFSDPDLNLVGEMQLAGIAQEVSTLGIERIFSSDLRRAFRTAQAIGKRTGVQPEIRPGLREIGFGLWEGLSWDDIEAQFPREAQTWIREFPTWSAPGGESYRSFCERVEAEFNSLQDSGLNEITAIVTHRGVMRYALTKLFGRCQKLALEQTANYGAVISVFKGPMARGYLP
jgi:broad specificity phosphatase PhoE